MIDVHVLTYSGTKAEWLDQCLRSLEGQPCTVRIVQGVEGNVGEGRALGYRLGDAKFVSYVDSDDYVLPGVMVACLRALQVKRNVVTRELRLWGDMFDSSRQGNHHLAVYRREDIEPLLHLLPAHPYHCDMVPMRILKPFQLEYEGYVWRIHGGQGHRLATDLQQNAVDEACNI